MRALKKTTSSNIVKPIYIFLDLFFKDENKDHEKYLCCAFCFGKCFGKISSICV